MEDELLKEIQQLFFKFQTEMMSLSDWMLKRLVTILYCVVRSRGPGRDLSPRLPGDRTCTLTMRQWDIPLAKWPGHMINAVLWPDSQMWQRHCRHAPLINGMSLRPSGRTVNTTFINATINECCDITNQPRFHHPEKCTQTKNRMSNKQVMW